MWSDELSRAHARLARILLALVLMLTLLMVGSHFGLGKAWHQWWKGFRAASTPDSAAPSVQASKSLMPLERLIPACRASGQPFTACMLDGGYTVNKAWQEAHKASGQAGQHADSLDYLQDAYRAGPSPTYGVPYWIERPPKKK